MELIRTSDFEADFERLPHEIQFLCELQLKRLEVDLSDPRLHRKPLKEERGVYSFRVTRRYRGLYYINARKQIIVFAIDNRKDVYR